MRVSPISVRNNNPTKFTSKENKEQSASSYIGSHMNDNVIVSRRQLLAILGIATAALVAPNLSGCSKASDPIVAVDPPVDPAVPVSPAQIKLLDMWKGLGVNIAGLSKTNSTTDTKSIKTISYYDDYEHANFDATLDATRSTADTTVFKEKEVDGANQTFWHLRKYSLDNGNLICKTFTAASENPVEWHEDTTLKYVSTENGKKVKVMINDRLISTLSPDTPTSVLVTDSYGSVSHMKDIIIK